MKQYSSYLRVLAGMFAAVMTWLAIVDLVTGDLAGALIGLLLAAGIWYLAIGTPLRQHFARVEAEKAGFAARAQAGHEAYLAGDPAAFAPPPEPTPRPKVRRGVIIAVAVATVLVVFGIITDIAEGLDKKSDAGPTSTSVPAPEPFSASTAAEASTARAEPAGAAGPGAVPSEASAAPVPAQPAPAQPEAAAVAPAVMPQVVCMNLQAAQDTIQDAGVFYSRSTDATGKGRSQIVDRNWVVVEQSPAAGTAIGERDAMQSVVKEGERGDCS